MVLWSPPEVLHRGITNILWYCPVCYFNRPDLQDPTLVLDPIGRDMCDDKHSCLTAISNRANQHMLIARKDDP
eukprot:11214188-Lingulodinium_polyedra.AAC.1